MNARLQAMMERVRYVLQPGWMAGRVLLQYPIRPEPRWGYDRPAHPELERIVEAGRDRYAEHLRSMLPFVDELAEISTEKEDDTLNWTNAYFQGLDAVSLYTFLAQRDPKRYVEVGAGNSTRFARQAIAAHGLRTRITSIDPTPRTMLAGLSDEHIDAPLETVDLSIFDQLESGDILMVDGTHYTFMNSDATVFFCEVLPRLHSGLLVYIDDVFLPWDYPDAWRDRWYSEQYLLAAWLLAGSRLEVTLPNFWIATQPDLHRILAPLWDRFTWSGTPTNGTGFWFTIK